MAYIRLFKYLIPQLELEKQQQVFRLRSETDRCEILARLISVKILLSSRAYLMDSINNLSTGPLKVIKQKSWDFMMKTPLIIVERTPSDHCLVLISCWSKSSSRMCFNALKFAEDFSEWRVRCCLTRACLAGKNVTVMCLHGVFGMLARNDQSERKIWEMIV